MSRTEELTIRSEAPASTGCRFYGMNGMFGALIPIGGNQCALIVTSHSPCRMEMERESPDETRCPLKAQLVSLLKKELS